MKSKEQIFISNQKMFKPIKVTNVHLFGVNNFNQNPRLIEMGKEFHAKTLLRLQNQHLVLFN